MLRIKLRERADIYRIDDGRTAVKTSSYLTPGTSVSVEGETVECEYEGRTITLYPADLGGPVQKYLLAKDVKRELA